MKHLMKNFSVVAQRSLLFVLSLGIFLSFGFGRNFEILGKPKEVNTTNRVISAVVECKGGKRDCNIVEVSNEKEMGDAMEACMQDGGRVQICPKNKTQTKK